MEWAGKEKKKRKSTVGNSPEKETSNHHKPIGIEKRNKHKVTPRSSERIRKIIKEKKKKKKNQERKPAGTSIVITWGIKKKNRK